MYSITIDTGVFNTGLNLNLCGMLAVLEGPNIMTGAVRTVSLRFNTYNGQFDGLFSSVDITARFTLGERMSRGPRALFCNGSSSYHILFLAFSSSSSSCFVASLPLSYTRRPQLFSSPETTVEYNQSHPEMAAA